MSDLSTAAILAANNESMQNASSGVTNSFGTPTELIPVLVLVLYAVGALLAAQFVAPWLAKSQLLSSVAGRALQSLHYALKGVGATAVLALVAAPVYFMATADGNTRGLALEVIGLAAAAYVVLVVLGWLADRAVTAFFDAHPEYDGLDDIFPDEPDDETEAVADGGNV